MDLLTLRDRLSYTQALLAVAAVALGGGVSWTSLFVFATLTAWSVLRRRRPEVSPTGQRWWTLGIALALIGSVVRAFLLVEFLDAGIDFLLLLLVQRFFHRPRTREHLQLLLLGTLLMIVAAVIHTGLSFPFLLALYLFCVMLALIVNQVVGEGERLGGAAAYEAVREAARSRRALLRSALRVTAMAALGALLTFVFFPRWGAGAFLRGAMAREPKSGFSGQVELGEFGRIKTDATVVARLRLPGSMPRPQTLPFYLRGSSLDAYEDGRWSYGDSSEHVAIRPVGAYHALAPEGMPLLAVQRGTRSVVPSSAVPGPKEAIFMSVTLEDLGLDVLFAASEPLGVRLLPRGPVEARTQVRAGRNRELRVDKPPGPLQYEMVARARPPSEGQLRSVGDPLVPESLAELAKPLPGLSPEVQALALRLTASSHNRYERVEALVRHLRGFAYTVEMSANVPQNGEDPVERFLFGSRAGHCEYFATALAALVRELGIPARIVNGFYGARYNDVGDFYAVRQADAHAWVEVHFGELGWITFDATPDSGRRADDAGVLWPAAWELFDAARNAYLEYIIDYNLSKQWSLLESLGARPEGTTAPRTSTRSWLVVFAACGLVVVAIRLRKRRNVARAARSTRELARVSKALRRAGHQHDPHETLHTLARRIAAQAASGSDGLAAALERFGTLYDRVRFGASFQASDLASLRQHADDVIAAARALKR